jgi:hypothetical protein
MNPKRYARCTAGIGLVCEHIVFAVDRGGRVGFYLGDDTDTARPDSD